MIPGFSATAANPSGSSWGSVMKVFLVALVFAAVVAVGTAVFLGGIQQSSSVAFTTDGARVSDPGHNLVGPG